MSNTELIANLRSRAREGHYASRGARYWFREAADALESAGALDGERLEAIAREQERYVKDNDILFLARKDAERERDAARDVIAEVRELAGAGVTNQDGCWMDAESCLRILAKATS